MTGRDGPRHAQGTQHECVASLGGSEGWVSGCKAAGGAVEKRKKEPGAAQLACGERAKIRPLLLTLFSTLFSFSETRAHAARARSTPLHSHSGTAQDDRLERCGRRGATARRWPAQPRRVFGIDMDGVGRVHAQPALLPGRLVRPGRRRPHRKRHRQHRLTRLPPGRPARLCLRPSPRLGGRRRQRALACTSRLPPDRLLRLRPHPPGRRGRPLHPRPARPAGGDRHVRRPGRRPSPGRRPLHPRRRRHPPLLRDGRLPARHCRVLERLPERLRLLRHPQAPARHPPVHHARGRGGGLRDLGARSRHGHPHAAERGAAQRGPHGLPPGGGGPGAGGHGRGGRGEG